MASENAREREGEEGEREILFSQMIILAGSLLDNT